MSARADVGRWLVRGAALYDAHPALASRALRVLTRPSPDAAVDWMRLALETLRGRACPPLAPVAAAALSQKYLASIAAGSLVYALARRVGAPRVSALGLGALGFYAVEVQGVFAVACALDGSTRPLEDSRARLAAQGGTLGGLTRVLPIAAHMLTPFLRGETLLRAWCTGCVAVLVWYDEVRSRDP